MLSFPLASEDPLWSQRRSQALDRSLQSQRAGDLEHLGNTQRVAWR